MTAQALLVGLSIDRYSLKPPPTRPSAKYHVLLTGPGCRSGVGEGVTAAVDVGLVVVDGVGEAKWQETMSASHLRKLEHIRELLVAKGEPGAQDARLFLFGGARFSDALIQRAAADPSIQLIGLDRLYYGS